MCPDEKQINFSFEKFLKKIVGDKDLVRVYYYNCPLDRNKDNRAYLSQQRFFEKLREIPNFKLVLCRMQEVKINGKQNIKLKKTTFI